MTSSKTQMNRSTSESARLATAKQYGLANLECPVPLHRIRLPESPTSVRNMAETLNANDMAILKDNDGKQIHSLVMRKMQECAKEKQQMFDLMFEMTAMMHGGGQELEANKRAKHDMGDEKQVAEHAQALSPLADFHKARNGKKVIMTYHMQGGQYVRSLGGHEMCANGHYFFEGMSILHFLH